MTDSALSREVNLSNIQRTLEHCLGQGKFPLEVVGDLDDLLFTLEPAIEILRRLSAYEEVVIDREQLLVDLGKLEYILTDELVLILTDLRPELRAIGVGSMDPPVPGWRIMIQKLLDYWRRLGKKGEGLAS